MNKTQIAIMMSVLLVSSANAETAEKVKAETTMERKTDGSYETDTSAERTDATGTTRTSAIKENVDLDADGEKKLTTSTKTTTDPKGLGNKTYSQKKASVETDARGSYEGEVTAKSVDAQGTAHKSDTERTTKVRSDGSTETTISDTKVSDPVGMMNKKTSETKEVIEKDAQGNIISKTKKVDGKSVESTND